MIVTALTPTGNSSKFHVTTRNGEFDLAISFTLRKKIWKLADDAAELAAAQALAEAVVSRHDMESPFRTLYIFAEHNTLATLEATAQHIRSAGF
jgi:hypothetical protein